MLTFVARRLGAESVGLVFALREHGVGLLGIPELEVQGLNNGDAVALLSSVVTVRLEEPVIDRIVAETRGNPLALLELPHGLNPTESRRVWAGRWARLVGPDRRKLSSALQGPAV